MSFRARKELEKEYYNYINNLENSPKGTKIKDCPFNVITFLEINRYISCSPDVKDTFEDNFNYQLDLVE